ncbi:hypothetical protein [Persicobacter psychrovividus]|uniref:Contractile injection system tube protein N-terminal domain-containing protein n=1 Tax=Persicobacter psychrovividus TaxID=387638 RepID=A0ABM7VK34_9BACT|nr:hypothetical protein PEPS_36290 [Persicobacter psychrovividus]
MASKLKFFNTADQADNSAFSEVLVKIENREYKKGKDWLEVQINPENISINSASVTNNQNKIDTPVQELKFELILDNTGVIPANMNYTINQFTQKFHEMCVAKQNLYAPPIFIEWGDTVEFIGTLVQYNIHHELFSQLGSPLRTRIETTFRGKIYKESDGINFSKIINKAKDIMVQLRNGDSISNITMRTTGDSSLIATNAKLNNCSSLRKTKP